jgi:Domain of unknown function (DUF4263)
LPRPDPQVDSRAGRHVWHPYCAYCAYCARAIRVQISCAGVARREKWSAISKRGHSFSDRLDRHEPSVLEEQKHILPFFRQHRNIAALIGHLYSDCVRIDRIAYEFDIFGDHAADLVVGDASRRNYSFIEFEDAAPDSIFRREGKKDTLAWGPRFERGYSQIMDWFWKLDDLSRTDTLRHRFEDARTIRYHGLLVIGRTPHLEPLERARLSWRRDRVVVDSKHIYCVTFDELRDDLRDKLRLFGLAAADQGFLIPRPRRRSRKAKKRAD